MPTPLCSCRETCLGRPSLVRRETPRETALVGVGPTHRPKEQRQQARCRISTARSHCAARIWECSLGRHRYRRHCRRHQRNDGDRIPRARPRVSKKHPRRAGAGQRRSTRLRNARHRCRPEVLIWAHPVSTPPRRQPCPSSAETRAPDPGGRSRRHRPTLRGCYPLRLRRRRAPPEEDVRTAAEYPVRPGGFRPGQGPGLSLHQNRRHHHDCFAEGSARGGSGQHDYGQSGDAWIVGGEPHQRDCHPQRRRRHPSHSSQHRLHLAPFHPFGVRYLHCH
mmetsp:Transcript_18947/g.34081  ORF Transcript_18947/g.34081 Transcript_18947/m.34081 type:complete len:278 (+) Transcript_18947:1640-2473(+)